MTTPSTHRRMRSMTPLASLIGLVFVASSCSGPADGMVGSRLLIENARSRLSAAAVTFLTGTYATGCSGHAADGTDTWTVSVSGNPAADELRVRRGNSSCVLALRTLLTADETFVAAPAIALDAANTFAVSASAFAKSNGPLAFHGNAKISALTYTADFTISLLVSGVAIAGGVTNAATQAQGSAPALLSTRTFAVLAGQTVTNGGGGTSIIGDLGVSPGTSVTGMPAGQPVGGTFLGGDAVVVQAQADLTTLYDGLAGRPCPPANLLSGQDLAGKTLLPGVYCFASSATLGVGALTLDADHRPDAFWVFQIGSTLSVAAGTVTFVNGGSACNVFWQVGSSATLLDGARFAGSIVAFTSITLNTDAWVSPGRALARNGAVTMLTNTVSTAACL